MKGRYNFVDLVPGTYSITFTLTGFRVLNREGIGLTSGFTATVNVELQVGSLEESITVSGAAPVVDTQNVRRQTAVTRDLLDGLPTSTKRIDTHGDADSRIHGRRRRRRAGTSPSRAPITASGARSSSSTAWASRTAPATAAIR